LKALRTTLFSVFAILCVIAMSTPGFAQAYGSYRDTGAGIISNQRWGFELLQMSGNLGFAPLTLKVTPAQSAVTSITTAQTLDTYSLPAGLMNSTGRALRVCFAGVYTSPGTTTPTITLALKIGSSVTPISVTSAAISSTASTNMPFQGCYTVVTAAVGATGTDEAHGFADVNVTANTPAAAAAHYLDTNTAVSSTYDHTAANTATLSIAASSSISSATLRLATWDLLN
jgi:hypothetical protein